MQGRTVPPPAVLPCYAHAWRQMWRHFWPLLLVSVVAWLIENVIPILMGFVLGLTVGDAAETLGNVAGFVFTVLVGIPLGAGSAYVYLRAARGQRPRLEDLFAAFLRVYPATLASGLLVGALLVFVAVPGVVFGLGLAAQQAVVAFLGVLLLLPGILALIILGMRLGYAPLLTVAEGLGPVAALSESWGRTRGHTWTLVGMGLLGAAMGLAAFAAAFVPALLVLALAAVAGLGGMAVLLGALVFLPVVLVIGVPLVLWTSLAWQTFLAAITAGERPPRPNPPWEEALSPVGAGLAEPAPPVEAPLVSPGPTGLSEPAPTAAGTLRLFGIPVRVRLWFFILAVFIAGPSRLDGPEILRVGIFVAIIFTAVLAHELGHAAAIRAIGHRPLLIEFHGLGGATHWQPDRPVSAARSVAVSFAGPAVGIALGGPAFIAHVAMSALGGPTEGLASEALGAFWWVNLGWGILNLLPIIPLDGGRIMSAFIGGIAPGKGMRVAHVISILLAVGVGLFALTLQAWWTAFLCGLFVMANVQGLRMLGQARGDASSPGRAGTSG